MVFEASSADEAWDGVVGRVRNSRAMLRRYSGRPLMASVGPLEVWARVVGQDVQAAADRGLEQCLDFLRARTGWPVSGS